MNIIVFMLIVMIVMLLLLLFAMIVTARTADQQFTSKADFMRLCAHCLLR